MNSSYNVTEALVFRDSSSAAVAKNVIVLVLGFAINCINGSLFHTFRKHQIFYMNPRYVLFVHLVLNDMIQLAVTISLFVFSYAFYNINASLCCLMTVTAVVTTLNSPLNLAVMAVERYSAVCLPLRHADVCTLRRTYVLVSCVWAVSTVTTLPDVFILVATEPATFFYSTVFCERDSLFRQKRDVSYITYLVAVWLTLFYSYFSVFFAAKSADAAATKARKTILLHGFQLLLCILTYISHIIKKALLDCFPNSYALVSFAVYIIVQIIPRFLSSTVYGLRDKTFRLHLMKHLLCRVRLSRGQRRRI